MTTYQFFFFLISCLLYQFTEIRSEPVTFATFHPRQWVCPIWPRKICPAFCFCDLYILVYVNVLITCVVFTSVGNEFCYNLFVLYITDDVQFQLKTKLDLTV